MDNLTWVWRLSLGLGAIPPLSVFYFRIKMKEGDRYAESSMRHAKIPYWLVIKFYWSRLIPVAIIWFLYDFSSYSFGIYSSTILSRVIPDSVDSPKDPLFLVIAEIARLCTSRWDGMSLFCCFICPDRCWGLGPRITSARKIPLQSVSFSRPSLVSSCLAFTANWWNILVASSSCVPPLFSSPSDIIRRTFLVVWRIWAGR